MRLALTTALPQLSSTSLRRSLICVIGATAKNHATGHILRYCKQHLSLQKFEMTPPTYRFGTLAHCASAAAIEQIVPIATRDFLKTTVKSGYALLHKKACQVSVHAHPASGSVGIYFFDCQSYGGFFCIEYPFHSLRDVGLLVSERRKEKGRSLLRTAFDFPPMFIRLV